jgi:peptidoglycan/LPS O-acetylase OafA/YrhL
MRSRPGVACGVLIALSLIATTMFARLGLLVFGVMHEWLPVFGIGMAVYYGWSGRLKPGAVTVLCLIAWCALVYNLQITQPFFLAYPTSYTTQIGYVIAVFLGGLWAMAAIRESARPVRFFSDISYSLYLMHYPIGVLTMDRLYPVLGFTASAVVSLALCFGASAVSLRLIERPAQNFGRALTRSPLFERPIPVPAKV